MDWTGSERVGFKAIELQELQTLLLQSSARCVLWTRPWLWGSGRPGVLKQEQGRAGPWGAGEAVSGGEQGLRQSAETVIHWGDSVFRISSIVRIFFRI